MVSEHAEIARNKVLIATSKIKEHTHYLEKYFSSRKEIKDFYMAAKVLSNVIHILKKSIDEDLLPAEKTFSEEFDKQPRRRGAF